jgi:hypothetical protein
MTYVDTQHAPGADIDEVSHRQTEAAGVERSRVIVVDVWQGSSLLWRQAWIRPDHAVGASTIVIPNKAFRSGRCVRSLWLARAPY